jgi:acyl carrier protein
MLVNRLRNGYHVVVSGGNFHPNNIQGGTAMIFEKVRAILAGQLDLEEDDITLDSCLVDDLGVDSLDLVDLVMNLEDEFDTEIPDEAIDGIKTVGDIVRYIEENLA